ncbi:MAG: hypothetical protein PHG99_05640 [Erysipelotrichaceae bacterium]|nr:hypothetical protein [Erysipelotrichaceae bacterium]
MAKISKIKINKQHIHFLLKQNRRFIILMIATMLILNPVFVGLLGLITDISKGLLIVGQVFNIILAIISTFIVASMMFSFLNKKIAIDVYHSLPIDRPSLHLTLYLGGLIILIIPFTLSWFVALPLHLFIDYPEIIQVISSYLYVIIPLLAIYTMVCYVQVNTGTSVDANLYGLIVILLPFFAYLCYFAYASALLLGFNYSFDWDLLSYLSPLIAIFYNPFLGDAISTHLITNQLYWIILMAILYFVIIKIYQRRLSERTQQPFTNRYFFPIVATFTVSLLQILLYSVFYMITYSESAINVFSLILAFLIAIIAYMILDAVAKRSFKGILKAGLHYFVVGVLVFVLIIPIKLTKGFGFIDHIPNNIQSVSISFYDSLSLIHNSNKKDYYFYDQNYQTHFTFTNKEDINKIITLHQTIIDNYQYFDYNENNFRSNYQTSSYAEGMNNFNDIDYDDVTYLTIEYLLDNGQITSREYPINYNWLGILLDLYQNDEFVKARIPLAYYHELITKIDELTLTDKFGSVSTSINDNFDFHEFAELYLLDHKELDTETIMGTDYQYYGRLNANICRIGDNNLDYCTNDYLDIDSRYHRVLAYLEKTNNLMPESNIKATVRVIFPDENNESSLFKIANFGYYYDDDRGDRIYRYTEINDEQLKQLADHLVPYGFTNTQTIVVVLVNNTNNYTYLLNPVYLDEALRLLNDNPIQHTIDIYEILYNQEAYQK